MTRSYDAQNVETLSKLSEQELPTFSCPCCENDINVLQYAFIIQMIHNPELLEAWMAGNYTYEMWLGENGHLEDEDD